MKKVILLVGCGQLGSRHLQSISTLENISEVHVFDINESSIELGKERLSQVSGLNREIKYIWHSELRSDISGGDLCIVATHAKERVSQVKDIANKFGYSKFIIEKMVAQSVEDYKNLMAFCDSSNVKAWVDCPVRTYSIHKYIKSKILPNDAVFFTDTGGNHGLGCNGVHAADLFCYYDGSKKIMISGSKIDNLLHASKRGKDFYDLSGTLSGETEKGGGIVIHFDRSNYAPEHFTIVGSQYRYVVDHDMKTAFECSKENNWEWKKLAFDENVMLSHMSKKFVSEILQNGTCDLPTLAQAFPAHEFILDQLKPHFSRLLKKEIDCCPVT